MPVGVGVVGWPAREVDERCLGLADVLDGVPDLGCATMSELLRSVTVISDERAGCGRSERSS